MCVFGNVPPIYQQHLISLHQRGHTATGLKHNQYLQMQNQTLIYIRQALLAYWRCRVNMRNGQGHLLIHTSLKIRQHDVMQTPKLTGITNMMYKLTLTLKPNFPSWSGLILTSRRSPSAGIFLEGGTHTHAHTL